MSKKVTVEEVQEAARPLLKSLERFSTLISGEVPESVLAPTYALIDRVEKASTTVKSSLKLRVRVLVEASGKTITEAGTKALDLAGWRMEIRPTGGSLDHDALHRLMKKKGLAKTDYCEKEVKWHPDPDAIQRLIGAGTITEAEFEKCKAERSFSVVAPVEIDALADEA